MHEAAIAENILSIAERVSEQEQIHQIQKVVLEIGQFSGVVPELLRIAFDIIKKNSILEDAELEMLRPPLVLFCRTCSSEYLGDREDLRCPLCSGEKFEIVQGNKMLIKEIIGE